jgi:hypothetical protein
MIWYQSQGPSALRGMEIDLGKAMIEHERKCRPSVVRRILRRVAKVAFAAYCLPIAILTGRGRGW